MYTCFLVLETTLPEKSGIPIWLDIVAIIVPLILASLTTYFIYRQIRLEKTRTKLEAYDRRLKIYNAIKIYIAEIQTYGTTTDAKSVTLLQETREALFLSKTKLFLILFLLYTKKALISSMWKNN